MNLMVSGASGFVGRHLAALLESEGLPWSSCGRRRAGDGGALRSHFPMDLLTCTPQALADAFEAAATTHFIHLAWYTDHADYLNHPVNERWMERTQVIAETFFSAGGRYFLGIGTCLEQAWPQVQPDLYGQAKRRAGQALMQDFGAGRVGWGRVFFLYGPDEAPTRLFPAMSRALRAGEDFVLHRPGARRDYLHVDDLAQQILTGARQEVGGDFDFGSGRAVALGDVKSTMARVIRRGRPFEAPARGPACGGQCGDDEVGTCTATGDDDVIEADLGRLTARIGEVRARSLSTGIEQCLPHWT